MSSAIFIGIIMGMGELPRLTSVLGLASVGVPRMRTSTHAGHVIISYETIMNSFAAYV